MRYSCEAKQIEGYDIVVAGGGPAGIGAGIAAARSGLKTLLTESFGNLGGVSITSNLPLMLGTTNGSIPFPQMVEKGLRYSELPHPREVVGGVFRQMRERIKDAGGSGGPGVIPQTDKYPGLDRLGCHDDFIFDMETGKRVLDEMASDAGLDLLYYTRAVDVKREGNKIEGVYVSNKNGISYIPCRAVIDCTGDADLIDAAGFATYKGDKETGEMTGITMVAHFENVDPGPLEKYLNEGGDPWLRDFCIRAAKENPDEPDVAEGFFRDSVIMFPMPQPGVFMVNGGCGFSGWDGTRGYDGSRAEDLTEIAVRGRHRAKFLLDNLFRKYVPGFENSRIRSTAMVPGVRETRRIVSLRALTEQDLVDGIHFEDTIALAGRHFDLYRKNGQPSAKKRLGGGFASIPYRCLVPKDADNIIAAGRCIEADGQAMGPARIMSTCMAVGEAAGTAAALAVKQGISLRDVNTDALRSDLTAHGAIVD